MGTLIALRWDNWIKLVMFISLSTQIYPDLPWLYLGCLEAWLSWRWWWSTMAKRHLASLTIWMWGLRRSMGSCPRTCCPRIWIRGLRRSMASCPRTCCPRIRIRGLRRSMGSCPRTCCPRIWIWYKVCDEAWEAARQHAAPQLRISAEHQGSWGPDLEGYEPAAATEHFRYSGPDFEGFALAAANADYGVIETSPSMKLAAQCIILHLERDKVVVRGE